MKTIFDHIERVKAQPHHIRKQVAFAAAAAGTVFIALVWFTGSLVTGAFSISNGNSFATSASEQNAAQENTADQNLAGAGAAAILPDADAPARIEIIDASSAPVVKKQAEQTTIPF